MHLLLLNEKVFKRGAPAIKAPVLHCRSLITFTNLDASGAFALVFFFLFYSSSHLRPPARSRLKEMEGGHHHHQPIRHTIRKNRREKRRKEKHIKIPWRPTTELRKKEKKQSEQL